jgi:hypothetical protein
MKNHSPILFAAVSALCFTLSAHAAEEPFQFSLWAPDVQYRPAQSDVRGLRLSIYGENHSLTGVDLGFVGVLTGDMHGYSGYWLYNRIDGEAFGVAGALILHIQGEGRGIASGCAAFLNADFTGLCGGVYSDVAGTLHGVQLGFVNRCTELDGVQFGFVNMAERGYGLQIGLVNIFNEGFCPVFPFFNFHF